MEERPAPLALKIVAFIMFLFLLAPVVLVVPISFSADSYMTFRPPAGACAGMWISCIIPR